MFGLQVVEAVRLSKLALLRKRIPGLSQDRVAELLQAKGIDISTSGYQRVERGETKVHFGDKLFIATLAEILQVSRQRLLAEADVLPAPDPKADPQKEWLKEQVDELDPENVPLLQVFMSTLRKQKPR